jgi:hypothetical protein
MKYKLYLIPLLTFLFYIPIFKYSFSQDDFIHLNASKASGISDFLNFFNPFYQFPDIFFFRPLSTQVYFFINSSLFGLNPLPVHFEGLIFHVINSFLVYRIVKSVWKNDSVAFLSALFYSVSANHFLSLYYISAFQQILRTFFLLFSILFYFKFSDYKKIEFLIYSLLCFLAALLSKETAVVIPFVILGLEMLKRKESVKKVLMDNLKPLSLFLVLLVIYLLIRAAGFITIFGQGDYNYSLSLGDIFQNLKWYILWLPGLPELLSFYPSLKPASLIRFTKDNFLAGPLLITFGLFMLSTLPVLKSFKKVSLKQLGFCLTIFLITLLPVLPLIGHSYPQYLDLGLVILLPIFCILILASNKVLQLTVIALFLILQFVSLTFSEQTHWTTHRAKVADFYHHQLSEQITPQTKTVIFIGKPDQLREVSVALAKSYALKEWFPQQIQDVQYIATPQAHEPLSLIILVTQF